MKEYKVPAPAGAVDTEMTVQLDDDEAKALGLIKAKKAAPPANKAKKAVANKKG